MSGKNHIVPERKKSKYDDLLSFHPILRQTSTIIS